MSTLNAVHKIRPMNILQVVMTATTWNIITSVAMQQLKN